VLQIDWQLPWFSPWAAHGKQVLQAWQRHPDDLASALNQWQLANCASELSPQSYRWQSDQDDSTQALSFRFVPQQALPAETAYEAFIFQHKQIPTRNNAHDFFNGLCWLRFPKTKSQLNLLQAQAIAKDGVGAIRGALRDALTLFDENAALWCAQPSRWMALQQKHWHELFVLHRDDWHHTPLVLFGHALMEKLMNPYKGITAHVLCLPMPELNNDAEIDAWLCQQLTPEWLQTKPYAPLPVSGIPGWWPGNEAPAFFEDKKVFRD
jgi:hypothetical protein